MLLFAACVTPVSSTRLNSAANGVSKALGTRATGLSSSNAANGLWTTLRNPFAPQTPDPSTIPIVVLPGFGNADVDYVTPLGQPEETGLLYALRRRGFSRVEVMPLARTDWLRVLGGVTDARFWKGTAPPEAAYGWYLRRAEQCITAAHEASGGERVLVLAHSAGGWLARALLADGEWESGNRASEMVRALVTLGAPHYPPPAGLPDMTRGALSFVADRYPGAHLADLGVRYVTVAGDAVVGEAERNLSEAGSELAGEVEAVLKRGAADVASEERRAKAARVAFNSYEMVCGEGGVSGDGVVPLQSAHLPGARQVTVADCLHSINEAGTAIPTDAWYGSESQMDKWLGIVLEEIAPPPRAFDDFAMPSFTWPTFSAQWPTGRSDNAIGDAVGRGTDVVG